MSGDCSVRSTPPSIRAISSTRRLVQFGNRRAGFVGTAGLVHEQVVVSLRSHLRQVRDGQDTAAFAEAAQELADDFRSGAADADIDFVEHQRRHARGLCRDHGSPG